MEKKRWDKKKKKIFIISLSALILVLIGGITFFSLKDGNSQNTLNPVGNKTEEDRIFSKDDITKATLLTQQFIDILSQYDGKPGYLSKEIDQTSNEINEKVNQQLKLFYNTNYSISSIPTIAFNSMTSDNNTLRLNRNLFVIGMAEEVYYKTINVHELIIPVTYTFENGNQFVHKIHFVKINNGELKVIKGFIVEGRDIKKLNNEATMDSLNQQKYINEAKEIGIQ